MSISPTDQASAISRRRLLASTSGLGAFLVLRQVLAGNGVESAPRFGPLRPDPNRLLDLPEGFSYRIISRAGDTMQDGLRVPAAHDGMAAFDGGYGRVVLICNHELEAGNDELGAFAAGGRLAAPGSCFDAGRGTPCPGGTTTLIYDPATGRVERQFLSLAGTEVNCAGGPTPWGSWLSCEETVSRADDRREQDHGWVFEIPSAARTPVNPVPLKAMGRFSHEAVAVDPATGVLYLTEDRPDSLFYRFLPTRPGRLDAGGRLQALALPDLAGADTRNWQNATQFLSPGQEFATRWIDLENVESPGDDLRGRGHAAGAALFARGEGVCWGGDAIYFACTSGGRIGAGQVFRYRPSPAPEQTGSRDAGTLQLFVESTDRRQLENCDNVVMAPWGDLLACEDAEAPCALVGITPAGGLYRLAENTWSESELAGACFSPDGRTLFVNLQIPGLTLAISGPFPA